jgi:hypothetical protein
MPRDLSPEIAEALQGDLIPAIFANHIGQWWKHGLVGGCDWCWSGR